MTDEPGNWPLPFGGEVAWAWRQQVDPMERLLLLAFCTYISRSGELVTTIADLCEATCASRSTVFRSLNRLEERGLVVRQSGMFTGKKNVYHVRFVRGVNMTRGGVTVTRGGCQNDTGRDVPPTLPLTLESESKSETSVSTGGNSTSGGTTETSPKTQPTRSFEQQFEAVWVNYPRKDSKKLALKAYIARRREGIEPATLAVAVTNYAKATKGKERSFMLLGATFFGPNERWKDYLTIESAVPEEEAARQRARVTETRNRAWDRYWRHLEEYEDDVLGNKELKNLVELGDEMAIKMWTDAGGQLPNNHENTER